ncbi:MAG TPA: tripartite tricarboxylate transporter substrate binding protein [Burkholderiales bacterium]|nr:tripartite tricarboxylate transporter substrate binding protein [Burkholderiales bacterium]
MKIRRSCIQLIAITCLVAAVAPGWAQNYPTKPVRYIMPTTGANELIGRLLAQGMSEALGQQVFVDVRAGAGGNIGAEIAARAPADGYTLLQITQSHTVNVSLYRSLAYDVVRDFAPVTKIDLSPSIVVVHPSVPAKSIGDLVRLAKAKPGALNYGSAGVGTSTFLAAELFKLVAGVNIVEVPYKGGAPAQTAVIAGEVSIYFAPIATALPFIRDGRLRALAVGSATRVPLLSDYPTVAESGYTGYESSNWHGLVVPAKTPKELIASIHAAAVTALKRPDIAKRMQELGLTPIGDQPDEFAEFIKADIEKWRKIVRQKGLTAD